MNRHGFESLVRDVGDFPEPGVVFKDLTPVFADAGGFQSLIDALTEAARAFGEIDVVLGLEARGFIVGPPVALALGAGFVPARKPGKLPAAVHEVAYGLEYGQDVLQIHRDAIPVGGRVLVVDDVLATGGTIGAALALIEAAGATPLGAVVVLEIEALGGRDRLAGTPLAALMPG